MEARVVAATAGQELTLVSATTIIIDGGGTSTDVAVVRLGSIIARTQLASFKPVGRDHRTDELCRSLGAWLASVGHELLSPSFILVGMSGVWSDLEKRNYLNAFTDAWVTYVNHRLSRTTVLSDVELVLFAGLRDKPGMVVIAGTGSIAVTRDPSGTIHRSGGWGPRIDDAGGGFWFGREALRAVARMLDGRGPDTNLIRPVAAFVRVDPGDRTALTEALRSTPVDRAARLAEAVMNYADEGDAVARQIRTHGVQELLACCSALGKTVPTNCNVVLYGSLFSNNTFRHEFERACKEQCGLEHVVLMDDVIQQAVQQLSNTNG